MGMAHLTVVPENFEPGPVDEAESGTATESGDE
jgi:hypothetical protein